MTVRVLREADVAQLVDLQDALQAVEESFLEQCNGAGVNEPRRRVRQENGVLHMMGGALVGRGYWGFKAYTTTRQGARFTINLYHAETGALLALLEAGYLGKLRTGAASGIATKFLARKSARRLAIFGSGYQAETQLAAIAAVQDLESVRVFSRSKERRASFSQRMSAQLDLPVEPAAAPEEAIEGAEIIVTITSAAQPVFPGALLTPGTHINAAGSNSAARTELDRETIARADRIYTDDVIQARIESGDLIVAYERNALNWGSVRPLADVVGGRDPGRQSSDEITLFESHGIALWDIALAAEVYERAVERGTGESLLFGS